MRNLLFAACLLLPGAAWAQLFGTKFKTGTYVLNNQPQTQLTGQLVLGRDNRWLFVKNADGKETKYEAAQVNEVRLDGKKYVPVHNIHVKAGLGGMDVENALAEQLDSGRVMLLRYTYAYGGPNSMGIGAYSQSSNAFLLRSSPTAEWIVAQAGTYTSGGKKFREAVRPFFAARPDLEKLVDDHKIDSENIQAAIHALNTNTALSVEK